MNNEVPTLEEAIEKAEEPDGVVLEGGYTIWFNEPPTVTIWWDECEEEIYIPEEQDSPSVSRGRKREAMDNPRQPDYIRRRK